MTVQNIQGFTVLENGKPAIIPNSSVWNKCFYTEFGTALAYTIKWLNDYATSLPENWQGEPIDYNGCGDTIEIRFNEGIEL